MTRDPLVHFTVEGKVATITMDRPRVMNAIDRDGWFEIAAAFDEAADDESLRAVVITGAGGRAFTSGADLSAPPGGTDRPRGEERADITDLANAMMVRISRLPIPVIAAIEGVAVGAGFSLALACHIRVAAEGSRVGAVFVRRGLVPDTGSTFLVPNLANRDQALKLLLTGRLIDAAEARNVGLVTEVVPKGEALSRALALANEIAANAPVPVRRTLELLNDSFGREFEAAVALEGPLVREILATHDANEGAVSFIEKRPPVWLGH